MMGCRRRSTGMTRAGLSAVLILWTGEGTWICSMVGVDRDSILGEWAFFLLSTRFGGWGLFWEGRILSSSDCSCPGFGFGASNWGLFAP